MSFVQRVSRSDTFDEIGSSLQVLSGHIALTTPCISYIKARLLS